jgi:hypothetical protein
VTEEADDGVVRRMTVARVREPAGADHVIVAFLESARFYRLLRSNPEFDESLRRLRAASGKAQPVGVRCASLDSDVIEAIGA